MKQLVAAGLLVLAAAAVQAQTAGRTVDLQVGDTMRFAPARIEARPGERLHVVLKDTGTMPKTAMAHNFVLLKKGADAKAFAGQSVHAHETDYIPPALEGEVIASTKLVGPGETAEVTFAAPDEPGEYTFLCSFPGHFAVGMKGVLVVK